MGLKDLHNNITAKQALAPGAITSNTTTNGTEVDRQGFEQVEFLILAGTITDGAYAVEVQESDTSGSGYTAVADNDLLGTEAGAGIVAADDNTVKKIGYRGIKRYVRLVVTSTGVTTGGTLGAIAVLGSPHVAKVA